MDPALCRELLDPFGSHEPRMAPEAGAVVSEPPEIEPSILSLKGHNLLGRRFWHPANCQGARYVRACVNGRRADCSHRRASNGQAECSASHKDEARKRVPCVARCSGRYVTCDAGVAYDKAKPWIDEQVKIAKKFFEELIKKLGDKYPPPLQTKSKNI